MGAAVYGFFFFFLWRRGGGGAREGEGEVRVVVQCGRLWRR